MIVLLFLTYLTNMCLSTDYEPNTAEDLEHVIKGVSNITTETAFTIVCFCSFAQWSEFHAVMEKYCNAGVDRRFVHFVDKQPSHLLERSFNTVECILVGFVNKSGQYRTLMQQNWKAGVEFNVFTGKDGDVRDCVMNIPSLKQQFRDSNGQVTMQRLTEK